MEYEFFRALYINDIFSSWFILNNECGREFGWTKHHSICHKINIEFFWPAVVLALFNGKNLMLWGKIKGVDFQGKLCMMKNEAGKTRIVMKLSNKWKKWNGKKFTGRKKILTSLEKAMKDGAAFLFPPTIPMAFVQILGMEMECASARSTVYVGVTMR